MTSGDDAPVEPGETPPRDHPRQGTPPNPPQDAPQPGTPPYPSPYGPPSRPGPAAGGPQGTPWPPQPGAYPWPSQQNPHQGVPDGPQPQPYGYPGGLRPGPHPGFPSGPQPQPGPYPGAAPGGAPWPGMYAGAQSGQVQPPGGSPAGAPAGPSPQSNPYPYTPPGGQAAVSSGAQGSSGPYPGPHGAPADQGAQQRQQGWQAATPPPPELWQMPTQPSAPRRRGWVLPVIAVAAVLLVAGGTYAFLSTRHTGTPRAAGSASAAPVAASASATPTVAKADVCSMLDPDEAERLVPNAKIDSTKYESREGSLVSYVTYTCTWANPNISYKDTTRSRKITLQVSKYDAIGTTTAEGSARIQYDGEVKYYKYRATISNKKRYYSKAQEYQGIGDEAAAQYQWTRDDLWYSFGEGIGRVGDVVFKVHYEASQKKKESPLLSAEGTQSITEENALREVKNLLSQAAKSVAAWRDGKPLPYHARPKPSPTPSPSPTRIPLPPACVRLEPLAATLVPKTEGAAVRSKEGNATVTQCQWWNDALPLGGGKVRWRNLRIAIHTFPDEDSARYYLIDQRSSAKFTESSKIGGIQWGKLEKLAGYGQDAFGQVTRQRTDTAHANQYEIYALDGKNVIWVLLSGNDRPENTPINAPESVLMDTKEAASGAKSVAKALLDAL